MALSTKLNGILNYSGALLKYSIIFCKQLSIETNRDVHDNLFRELGVSGKMCKCLSADDITIPTVIQHEVLPVTLHHTQHCIIQSPTGSGKTLAFLIPALQDASPGLHSLIIVPSRELAVQIGHLAGKMISRGRLSRSVSTLYSGGNCSVRTKDASLPNIVVGTPRRVLEMVNSEASIFKSLRRIVVDEVDKLIPSNEKKSRHEHVKPTLKVMKKFMHTSHGKSSIQCIASSATINEELINELVQCGWSEDYCLISTSQVESLTTPKSIHHGYIVDSSASDTNLIHYNKLDMLASYLRKHPGKSMVVIHRNAPISTFVFELKQMGVNAIPLHEHTMNAAAYSTFLEQFQSGNDYYNTRFCC